MTSGRCAKLNVRFVRVQSMNMDGPGSDAGADMKPSQMNLVRVTGWMTFSWHAPPVSRTPRFLLHLLLRFRRRQVLPSNEKP